MHVFRYCPTHFPVDVARWRLSHPSDSLRFSVLGRPETRRNVSRFSRAMGHCHLRGEPRKIRFDFAQGRLSARFSHFTRPKPGVAGTLARGTFGITPWK